MANKWCSLPFKGVLTENDGTFTTCCHGTPAVDLNTGLLMTRETHSIQEVFDSKWFENIRNNLSAGIEDSNCNYCWHLESQGVESFRQTTNQLLRHEERDDTEPQLELLDLSLGNQCNLKCRTCIPEDSSLWVKEHYDCNYTGADTYQEFQKKIIFLESEDSNFIKGIKQSLSNVKLIKFFGGEPFLMKRTWDVIQEAVTINRAQFIELYFNTNGTIWNTTNTKLFDHFEKVNIALSIDGIGDRFEYMRHPAKWSEVLNNIKVMTEWRSVQPESRQLFLTHTVSAFNIWYVPEVVKFARQHNLELYINPCLLQDDTFNIQRIPQEVKQLANSHIMSAMDYTEQELREIRKLVDYTSEGSDWKEWLEEVKLRDNYRNESFQKTFTEYYNLLKLKGYI
jgi:sulfatase maturation enzyme AslB (radical SAM superfamily)